VWVDSVFFKGAYDYHKTLKRTSEAMTSILNLERLADYLLSSIIADMRVTSGSLLLMNEQRTGLKLLTHHSHASYKKVHAIPFLTRDSAIVTRLDQVPESLMREVIEISFLRSKGRNC
jgi:hypothetical protein